MVINANGFAPNSNVNWKLVNSEMDSSVWILPNQWYWGI